MRISILTENCASGTFKAEHGLSYFIESGKNILFDTGHSDIFLENAQKLNLDLSTTQAIVLSHGHWDHGNGLKHLSNKKLICHPGAFIKRYRKGQKDNIGLAMTKSLLLKQFELSTSRQACKITDNCWFLGQIKRKFPFEAQSTTFEDENGNEDFVIDDTGIVFNLNNELIILTGCAHSGVCNMIEQACKITGIQRIKAVIGGFHLKTINHQVRETIQYLKTRQIPYLYPSHCTQLPVLAAFYNEFSISHLKSGMQLEF